MFQLQQMNQISGSFSPSIRFRFSSAARAFCLTACLSLGCLTHTASADWRSFRGSSSTGLPAQTASNWDGEQALAWQAELPGRGLSSPIIVGDRVFVTCSSGPMQETLHVLAFQADSGEKLWERTFWATGRTVCHPKTCVAAPSPASDGERIFAFYSSNDLACLDLDGNILWFRGLTYDYPNASNSLGMASSALALGDSVIVMVESDDESFAAAIDSKTGATRWKIDRPARANWTSPSAFMNGEQVLLQSSAGVSAVDVKSGEVLWTYADGAATQPTLVSVEEVAYVPSHGLTAIRPGKSNADVPEIVWQASNLQPGVASPIALGDKVFVINNSGVMVAGSREDGSRLWQSRLGGSFSASPVMTGGKLFAVNEAGKTFSINPEDGKVISNLELEESVLSTPSVGPDGVYVRSDGHLFKIGLSD